LKSGEKVGWRGKELDGVSGKRRGVHLTKEGAERKRRKWERFTAELRKGAARD